MILHFQNEACARCGVPADIHRAAAVPSAEDLPHATWGDLNRCLEFEHCVPPRAAYGQLPRFVCRVDGCQRVAVEGQVCRFHLAQAPTFERAFDRRRLFVELINDLAELSAMRLAPVGSQVADRQTLALALAELSLRRPGWFEYLREMAERYLGAAREFEAFRQTSADIIAPEAVR